MKIKIIVAVLLMFYVTDIKSQNRLVINTGFGYYLHNSENGSRIMGSEKFAEYYSFGLSYQRLNVFGLNLLLDFNYDLVSEEKVQEMPVYSYEGSYLRSYWLTMDMKNYKFDLAYILDLGGSFSLGAGPSFLIVNRTLEMEDQYVVVGEQRASLGLYDRLASSALGAHAFLAFSIPINKDNSFFFTTKMKFRYVHSVWFDKGIRKLDNYKQEFITSELSAGIGYAF